MAVRDCLAKRRCPIIMPDQARERTIAMLDARPIPAFSDNYIWLLTNGNEEAFVVDPGDARPVLDALERDRLKLAGILVTHHHPDHVGGVDALLSHCGQLTVYGPARSPATCINRPLDDGDRLEILGLAVDVIAVPGHTLDHIAYFFPDTGGAPSLFCGDTLFAGGCGRVFEGDPEMMHASLQRLAALPAETRVYCAHEYTMANLRFARAVEPDNETLQERERRDAAKRERDEPTVPSTVALELATNPFLRCAEGSVRGAAMRESGTAARSDADVFAAIRGWKDNFR